MILVRVSLSNASEKAISILVLLTVESVLT